jgi:hypothetical protein
MKRRIRFKYVLLILLILICTVITQEFHKEVLATSPSFVRQEIEDQANNDGWNYLEGQFTKGHRYADLSSIGYSSNGGFLNATLFFNHPVTDRPLAANHTAYGMLINIDSDYNTGWQGYDYMMMISWENNTKNWTYLLQEWSSNATTRVLENKSNFGSFLDNKESKYVYLSLDLQKINFPDKYLVVFFTDYDFEDGGVKYQISDFSDTARIPPPQFVVSTSPNSVSLRPGEKKTVEVQVNSSTAVFESHAIFSTNKMDGLQTDFTPKESDIPQVGIATSHLNIKAAADSEPNPYTLLIFANISFPIQYSRSESGLTKVVSKNISEHSTLSLTVLPSLTAQEQFTSFWTTYGELVKIIGGGFAGGSAAMVFDRFSKKKTKEKEKTG